MDKVYERITWQDAPSMDTPLGARNLNKIDYGLNEIDNRVISIDTSKADLTEISELFKEVDLNDKTGVLTFTRVNGSTLVFNTPLNKVSVNFSYNPATETLIIENADGTTDPVDLSALITEYEFLDSDTIAFSIADGKVTTIVKEGSIEEKHLRTDYLADIKVETAKADASATAAATGATESNQSATESANSAAAAKTSETNATASALNAKTSEDNASASAAAAKTSESNASASAANSKSSESNAKSSEAATKESETNASKSADAAKTSEINAKSSEAATKTSENNASDSANLSKSYAVGGTGTRNGEDADNAKYYMEITKSVSDINIATTEIAGIVKADGSTITVDEDGTIHAQGIFTKDDIIVALGYTPVQSVSITLTENGHLESEVI